MHDREKIDKLVAALKSVDSNVKSMWARLSWWFKSYQEALGTMMARCSKLMNQCVLLKMHSQRWPLVASLGSSLATIHAHCHMILSCMRESRDRHASISDDM